MGTIQGFRMANPLAALGGSNLARPWDAILCDISPSMFETHGQTLTLIQQRSRSGLYAIAAIYGEFMKIEPGCQDQVCIRQSVTA